MHSYCFTIMHLRILLCLFVKIRRTRHLRLSHDNIIMLSLCESVIFPWHLVFFLKIELKFPNILSFKNFFDLSIFSFHIPLFESKTRLFFPIQIMCEVIKKIGKKSSDLLFSYRTKRNVELLKLCRTDEIFDMWSYITNRKRNFYSKNFKGNKFDYSSQNNNFM